MHSAVIIKHQLRANDLPESEKRTIETRLMEARKLLRTLDELKHFKVWKSPKKNSKYIVILGQK